MDNESSSNSGLAQDRTDLAEDRTLLASERTFGGWTRTAMASIGVALGLNALFAKLHPVWVPKAIATLFIGLGILIMIVATRRAFAITNRLQAHQVSALRPVNVRVIAAIYVVSALALIGALWIWPRPTPARFSRPPVPAPSAPIAGSTAASSGLGQRSRRPPPRTSPRRSRRVRQPTPAPPAPAPARSRHVSRLTPGHAGMSPAAAAAIARTAGRADTPQRPGRAASARWPPPARH